MNDIDKILIQWRKTKPDRFILLMVLKDYMSTCNVEQIHIKELGIEIDGQQIEHIKMYDSGMIVCVTHDELYDNDWLSDEMLIKIIQHVYDTFINKPNENNKETDFKYDLKDMKVFDIIKPMIYDICGIDDIKIDHDIVNDLGFDSLDKLDLISHIEHEFGITIDFDNFDDIHTIYDVIYEIKKSHKIKYGNNP